MDSGFSTVVRDAPPRIRTPACVSAFEIVFDDAADHVRGPAGTRLILEYGDYECPYSRRAFREIERVERRFQGGIGFAFRHFDLDLTRFDTDRTSHEVMARIRPDVDSGLASGEVRGTPTLFIDGGVYRGSYDAANLMEALAR